MATRVSYGVRGWLIHRSSYACPNLHPTRIKISVAFQQWPRPLFNLGEISPVSVLPLPHERQVGIGAVGHESRVLVDAVGPLLEAPGRHHVGEMQSWTRVAENLPGLGLRVGLHGGHTPNEDAPTVRSGCQSDLAVTHELSPWG